MTVRREFLWARWTAWLDIYVKNPERVAPKIATDDGSGSMN